MIRILSFILMICILPSVMLEAADSVSGSRDTNTSEEGWQWKRFIDKNKIWHYRGEMNETRRGRVEFYMQFGEDTVVDGKTYTKLQTTRQVYFKEYNYLPDGLELGPGKSFNLLREEGRKVYMHRPVAPNSYLNWPYTQSECVLYDFGLEVGESYSSVNLGRDSINVRLHSLEEWRSPDGTVLTLQTVMYSNKEFPSYGPVLYLEGFGPISPDREITIIGETNVLPTQFFPLGNDYPTMYGGRSKIVKVTDLEGNTIVTPSMVAGIKEAVSEEMIQESPVIYSLQGMPVSNPQPGGIYIRNGRKFVMPKE